MSELKIWFSESEDDLRRWFKQTYGDRCSAVLKDYIKTLAKGSEGGGGSTPITNGPADIIRRAFADVTNEARWI
ncbi:hypothetical protein, partial [Methanorbis furvi]|uniref:hypothetical protein n=1 Tax=Methanorbis furvi TaxID=3028299 RepID=UPI0030B919B0